MIDIELHVGDLTESVRERLAAWDAAGAVRRLWDLDTTLWAPDPPPPELADRLGWLELPESSRELLDDLEALRRDVPFWITDLVLLGMGGSSLAPEVLARTLGAEGLPLTLVDTTHPRAIRDMEWLHPANALFVVSSKSGTTLETLSLFRHFWSRTAEVTDEPGSHFVAVTDPGSPLAELAEERAFRAIFAARPDVGGRFSALSAFGLVPAALMGIDASALLDSAAQAAEACRVAGRDNPAFVLAAALGEATLGGRDKVTFVTGTAWTAFPDWAEQLIAESTGKGGTGIVPVAHEPELHPADYGSDRLFVGIVSSPEQIERAEAWGEVDDSLRELDALRDAGHPVVRIGTEAPEDIGALFLVWEIAVAMAGAALEIHPFDQPDVELAKRLARRAMTGEDVEDGDREALDLAWHVPPYGHAPGRVASQPDPRELEARVRAFLEQVGDGDYVGIQAYLAGGDPAELEELQALRAAIARATGAATTLGYGPRFLHSTGQLHKGGPDNGVFLQLADDAGPHVHVPEADFTFRQLIRAQARGDLAALRQRGRRVLPVRVDAEGVAIRRLRQLIEGVS